MEDYQILELFLNRDQTAMDQARRQYGDACRDTALRILGDPVAAEAAVREAICRAWETIPPKEPKNLHVFLLRLTRDLAIDHAPAQGEYDRVLRELGRCILTQPEEAAEELSPRALRRALDDFLGTLSDRERNIFVLRYWYLCSLEEIARRCGCSPEQTRGILKQLRTELRDALAEQSLSGLDAGMLLWGCGQIRDSWILNVESRKKSLPPWALGAALGAAICCVAALCLVLFSRGGPGGQAIPSQPPVSSSVPGDTTPSTAPGGETTPLPTASSEPEQTLPPIGESPAYQKLLTLYNAQYFDPTVLEDLARYIDQQEGIAEIYCGGWELYQFVPDQITLYCYTPLDPDFTRDQFSVFWDYGVVSSIKVSDRSFPSVPREVISEKVYGADDSIGVDNRLKEAFIDFILYSDWFPQSTLSDDFRTEWYFANASLEPGKQAFPTLFVKVWEAHKREIDEYTLCSLFFNGFSIQDRFMDEPTIRDSDVYQKLLTLENAEWFEPHVLEGFAHWMECEDYFLERYPEKWKLTPYADGGAGLVCHSPLDDQNKCTYYRITSYDSGGLLLAETGERLFTDIPREEVAARVYAAEDSIGVDPELKEAFIDFIMDSDWFAWSVLDPDFRTAWYFTTSRFDPSQPEYITLAVEVWMEGMPEDETVLCSLHYNGKEIRNGINNTGIRGGILSREDLPILWRPGQD